MGLLFLYFPGIEQLRPASKHHQAFGIQFEKELNHIAAEVDHWSLLEL